jgi:hypothetical protein
MEVRRKTPFLIVSSFHKHSHLASIHSHWVPRQSHIQYSVGTDTCHWMKSRSLAGRAQTQTKHSNHMVQGRVKTNHSILQKEPFIMRLAAWQIHTSVDTLNFPTPARHHPPCSSKTSRNQPGGLANTTRLGSSVCGSSEADDTMSKSYACL